MEQQQQNRSRKQVFQHQKPPPYSALKLMRAEWKRCGHFAFYNIEIEGTGHVGNDKTGKRSRLVHHKVRQQNRQQDILTYSISYEDSTKRTRTSKEATIASNMCHQCSNGLEATSRTMQMMHVKIVYCCLSTQLLQ